MLGFHAGGQGFDEIHVGLELGEVEKWAEGELPQDGEYLHGEEFAVDLGPDRFEHIQCRHHHRRLLGLDTPEQWNDFFLDRVLVKD